MACIFFIWPILETRAKSTKNFDGFLEFGKPSKIVFEMNWPLFNRNFFHIPIFLFLNIHRFKLHQCTKTCSQWIVLKLLSKTGHNLRPNFHRKGLNLKQKLSQRNIFPVWNCLKNMFMKTYDIVVMQQEWGQFQRDTPQNSQRNSFQIPWYPRNGKLLFLDSPRKENHRRIGIPKLNHL